MSPAAVDENEQVLVFERTFLKPPSRVFAAFETADMMRRWMGPEGITCPEGEVDFRIGGDWSITMKNSAGALNHVSGCFTEIKPDAQIAFSWAWMQEDGTRGHETVVSIVLRDAPDGGTTMTFVQGPFQDGEARNNHEHGWAGSFDKLVRLIDGPAKMR